MYVGLVHLTHTGPTFFKGAVNLKNGIFSLLNSLPSGHLKLSSAQMPWQDMKIIAAGFAGSVIREEFGNLSVIQFSLPICFGELS